MWWWAWTWMLRIAAALLVAAGCLRAAKALAVAAAAPLLAPLGIAVGAVGLRDGLQRLSYTPPKPPPSATRPRPRLRLLRIARIRVAFSLSRRKATLALDGLDAVFDIPPAPPAAHASSASVLTTHPLSFQHSVDLLVARVLKFLRSTRRFVNIVFWIGLLEIRVQDISISLSNQENTARIFIRDEGALLNLETDVLKEDGNNFVVNIRMSPVLLESDSNDFLVEINGESQLKLKVNMRANSYHVELSIPHVIVSSLNTLADYIQKLNPTTTIKVPSTAENPARTFLEDEYLLRKDYYISLFRNAFLSTIHSFKPSLTAKVAKIFIGMPRTTLTNFDEFDAEIPPSSLLWEDILVETSLTSETLERAERVLWLKINIATKALKIDVELRPGFNSSVVSLPQFSAHIALSIPMFSLAHSSIGHFVFNSNLDELNIILPSRLFIVLSILSAQRQVARRLSAQQPPTTTTNPSEKLEFWAKQFRKHYEPAISLSMRSPVVGLRLGAYTGIDGNSPDAVFALLCDSVAVHSATHLQLTPATGPLPADSPVDAAGFKALELQVFMAPVRVEAAVVGRNNPDAARVFVGAATASSAATGVVDAAAPAAEIMRLLTLAESRSAVAVWLASESGVLVDVKTVAAHLTADLTDLATGGNGATAAGLSPPHTPRSARKRPQSIPVRLSPASGQTYSSVPALDPASGVATSAASAAGRGLDFFAVAASLAGLQHKIALVRASVAAPIPGAAAQITFAAAFELKAPRVSATCSATRACGVAIFAADAAVRVSVAADGAHAVIFDARELRVDACAGQSARGAAVDGEPTYAQRECVARAHEMCVVEYRKSAASGAASGAAAVIVRAPQLEVDVALWKVHACFAAALPVIKMGKILNARHHAAAAPAVAVDVAVALGAVGVEAVFANGSRLRARLRSVDGAFETLRGAGRASVTDASVCTPDKRGEWVEVLRADGAGGVRADFKKRAADEIVIAVNADCLTATNPFGFEFADLFEDVINFQKAVKNLVFDGLGLVSLARLGTMGNTVFEKKDMPEYRINVAKVVFRILDDEFESKLGRNYRASFLEQFGRLARDKAFQSTAVPLRDANGGEISSQTEDAFWNIQEYNSRNWIKIISGLENDLPPLLNATVLDLSVVVKPPTLPCKFIEQSIHFIDPETPVAVEYDDLIARDVMATIAEMKLQLRDFPAPFVFVPAVSSGRTWKTEGLLIIADLMASVESKRTIGLSLAPVEAPPIVVSRNLCPVKIFAQSRTTIQVSELAPVFISWGMCMEPPLADMIRVLDTFTKATVDPSPPVGWWDKMRHMVHLGETVFNIEGGDLKVRILGSYTPHYDARLHHGTEGVDLAFGGGVRIELHNSGAENVVVQCGRCTFSIPNSPHEAGRIAGAHRAAVADEVFAQFVGGVRIAAGLRFTAYRDSGSSGDGSLRDEVAIWKSHSDVVLKLPQFAVPAYGDVVDSYYGFRSNCIHVVYDVQAPFKEFVGTSARVKEQVANFVSFSNDSLNRFMALIPVYQSPLAVIPIRRGPLFETIPTPQNKPKLGRSIKSNHVKGSMHPLMISYLCEFEDATGGVGLRCRSEKMDIDLVFNQINVTVLKEGADAPTNIYRWVLDTAHVEFTEVEGRTISFGNERNGVENKYCVADTTSGYAGLFGGGEKKDDGGSDRGNWFLPIDYNYVTKITAIDMIPFVWSPKVKYYKRNGDMKFESEHKIQTESEVRNDQIQLYQQRSDELEYDIRQYIHLQKSLADKKELFGYESVQSEIDLITAKLEILFEKKNTIERHIRSSVKHMRDFEKIKLQEPEGRIIGGKDAMFDHHYVVHNIRFLWKQEVRNIILRFFALLRRQSVLSYCLSNAALKTVKELLNVTIAKSTKRQRKRNTPDYSSIMSTLPDDPTETSQTHELLESLLSDLDNLYVPHEQDGSTHQFDTKSPNSATSPDSVTNLADLILYRASSDPESSDYIAPNMCVNSTYIVQCINPQVNFEVPRKAAATYSSAAPAAVVVVAETMQFRSVRVLEATAVEVTQSNMNLADDRQRQNEDLIKTRTILNVQNAQFFTCAYDDVAREAAVRYNHRHNTAIDDLGKSSGDFGMNGGILRFWPAWVPIENVTWNDFEVDPSLQKIVARSSASLYRDKPNPLFVQRNSFITKADFVDSYTIDFPNFKIEANSKQFYYVIDIITNLLMYHDPSSGERTKRLRKMMLALDQMTDLTAVLDSVLILQEKIRQGSKLLQFGKRLQAFHEPSSSKIKAKPTAGVTANSLYNDSLKEQDADDVRRQLLRLQEEMYVIVECLKAQTILEQKKNSVEVALQMSIHAKNLVWTMMQAAANSSSNMASSKFARWTITDSRFQWVQNEDQSSVNTLEIDRLNLENLIPGSAFRNMISPFGETRNVDFRRSKMARVYWREMAPVAGIKVVDHFEMNIYPLLLQISRDTSRVLEKYFFPKKAPDQEDEMLNNTNEIGGAQAIPSSNASKSGGGSSVITAASSAAGVAGGSLASSGSGTAVAVVEKKSSTVAVVSKQLKRTKPTAPSMKRFSNDFQEMQMRAAENRSFIYIKVPTLQLCLSYKGAQKKNIEDLNMFTFLMPTLEYRNKTWSWEDLFSQLKRDAVKAVLHNSGALVRDKLLKKSAKQLENDDPGHPESPLDVNVSATNFHNAGDGGGGQTSAPAVAGESERARKPYFRVGTVVGSVAGGSGKKKGDGNQ